MNGKVLDWAVNTDWRH